MCHSIRTMCEILDKIKFIRKIRVKYKNATSMCSNICDKQCIPIILKIRIYGAK